MLCLIYHRNFDGVIALYDSNRYIKRLNNIKIEKNALFWAVKSQFSDGGLSPRIPLTSGSQSATIIPLPPLF
jgi:hypothetical protein